VLRDLQFKVAFPCPVYGDNQSALAVASVPETKQPRHINLREHWIRNVVLHLGDLIIASIPGVLNERGEYRHRDSGEGAVLA
jgi:hypothetical protein